MILKNVKDYASVLGYEPSEYQTKIFDFVVHNVGNAVIKARAGSGKTATIITCMKLVPENKSCIFLAFNKSVKQEIEKKLIGHNNCKVKTVHGLGYDILQSNFPNYKFDVDELKYVNYLRQNFDTLTNGITFNNDTQKEEYINNVIELLSFARMDLSQSENEIKKSGEKRSLNLISDEVSIVLKLMKWGKKNCDIIDYTDMVWLPNELKIQPKLFNKYDWIFNDEAQDYTIAYVKLFLKCFKRGARFISCGDEFQAINQFAGASQEAFNNMINYPNTQLFDLPISYRCDRNIIKQAQRYVPDIQYRENAGIGLIKYDSSLKDIGDNDMVLSRKNAPLFKMYAMLIDKNKPCYIKGKESDTNILINIIKNTRQTVLSPNFESDGLFPRLYLDLINERNKLLNSGVVMKDAIHAASVEYKYDIINSLLVLSKGCDTVECLIKKIESIFQDKGEGICLSTIHKAKGLESDNVHILCRSEMFNNFVRNDSSELQERNLLYVAITRAKHKLCYVDEKEFPTMKIFAQNDNDDIFEFDYIEDKVCNLYQIEPVNKNNLNVLQFKVNNFQKIELNQNKREVSNKFVRTNSHDDILKKLLE